MRRQQVTVLLIVLLAIGALVQAGAAVQIRKPTAAQDNESQTVNESWAFDVPALFEPDTWAFTSQPNADPSVTWTNWNTTDKQIYENLNLSVTVNTTGFALDEWAFYYDNTTDTTCNSDDRALTPVFSGENQDPAANFSVTLPPQQPFTDLSVCLWASSAGGLDSSEVSTVDIRTEGDPDTTAPRWRNQQQNMSAVTLQEPVELAAQGRDAINLSHATLATNESGSWQNRSDYGSPMQLYTGDWWTWSNFTWTTDSVTGAVGWRIWYNDTAGNYNATDTNAFRVTPPYLAVNLTQPPSELAVVQNDTFTVNATVTCRDGDCGHVNTSARYNATGANPDTPLPANSGKPFHTTTRDSTVACDVFLDENETCFTAWTVNATGDIGSTWALDVNASSNMTQVAANDTDDTEVDILAHAVGLNMYWDVVDFGNVEVGDTDTPAENNSDRGYNLSVTENSDVVDLWVRGTNLLQEDGNHVIGIGNVSWNATANDPAVTAPITETFQPLQRTVSAGVNITTFYWADIPYGIYADNYTGTLEVMANITD